MSLRPPKLNSVERFALYQGVDPETGAPLGRGITTDQGLDGVTVGIKFVGTELADTFRQRVQANQLAEAKRVAELRKGHTKETAPELWDLSTPEQTKASLELVRDVLKAIVADVQGEGEVLEGEECQQFLAGLPYVVKTRLVSVCLEAQGASRRQIFRAPDARPVQAEGPPNTSGTGP